MSLAPLLLLILPLVLFVAQLLLRKRLGEASSLRKRFKQDRPPSPGLTPWATEVDLSTHPLFHAPGLLAPLDAEPYFLVLDTETRVAIDEAPAEAVSQALPSPSPVIALTWQVLDEDGRLMSEEYHLLRQEGRITPEATRLHGLGEEDLRAEGEAPRLVLERFLRVTARAKVLVAHHLRFHRAMIVADLEALGLPKADLLDREGYCTMEGGKALGFKRRRSGEASYPRLSELFGQLYYERPHLALRYQEKGLRDVRLCSACLRALLRLPSYRPLSSLRPRADED